VTDLLVWQEALASGRVVSTETYRAMTTPTVLASGDTVPYGFGLSVGRLGEHRTVSHGGGITGFNAHLAYYPDAELGVAVLVNTSTGWASRIAGALARAGLDMERPVRGDLPLSADQRSVYVGTYDLGGGREFRVFEEQDALLARPSGSRPLPLLYYGNDTFRPDLVGGIVIEFEIADGRATGFVLTQGDDIVEASRVD
jgi:hypothetical protein